MPLQYKVSFTAVNGQSRENYCICIFDENIELECWLKSRLMMLSTLLQCSVSTDFVHLPIVSILNKSGWRPQPKLSF